MLYLKYLFVYLQCPQLADIVLNILDTNKVIIIIIYYYYYLIDGKHFVK